MKFLLYGLLVNALFALTAQVVRAQPPGGAVVGWGFNPANGTTLVSFQPAGTNHESQGLSAGYIQLGNPSLGDAIGVAAGFFHSLAVLRNGEVFGWGGFNLIDQVTGAVAPQPVSTNGIVKISGQPVRDVLAVAVGRAHSLALKRDGSVVAWGDNQFGQSDVPAGLGKVIAVAAGGNHSLVLRSDGTATNWGEGNGPPDGLSNIVSIAAGRARYGNDLALKNDGTVVEWELSGVPRELPVPFGHANIVAIAAGANHSLALKSDGTVVGWGANNAGQATGSPTQQDPRDISNGPGGLVTISGQVLSNVVAIAAGNEYSLALRKDGTVVSWGHPFSMQMVVPPGLSNVVAIAAGENFCLAVTTNFPAMPSK